MRVKLEHWEHNALDSEGVSNVFSEEFECTHEEYLAMVFFAECRYQSETYEGVPCVSLAKKFLIGKEDQYQKWMLDDEGIITTDITQYLTYLDSYDLDCMFEEVSRYLPEMFKYYDNTDKNDNTRKACGGVFRVIQLSI